MYTLVDLSIHTGLTHKELRYYMQQGFIPNDTTFHKQELIKLYKILILKTLEFPYTAIYTMLQTDSTSSWVIFLNKQIELLQKQDRLDQRNIVIIATMLELLQKDKFESWDNLINVFRYHYDNNSTQLSQKTRKYMRDLLRIYDNENHPIRLNLKHQTSVILNVPQKISS